MDSLRQMKDGKSGYGRGNYENPCNKNRLLIYNLEADFYKAGSTVLCRNGLTVEG
jgi:hypothetical protein